MSHGGGGGVKTKAGKDGKPKGRMSAYTFFVQTCRDEHRKKHPNENVNFTEFSKKCAERWKVCLEEGIIKKNAVNFEFESLLI